MAQFFLQVTADVNGWLTTKNSYSFVSTDINNRLVMYDYGDGSGYLGAPGWQWGNQINNHVLDDWGGSAYWTDNSFYQKGVPITYLPDGQICQQQDNNKRLCHLSDLWIYWSSTPNDPNTTYLIFKKVDTTSEEAQKLAASHPHARAPVPQRPATDK
jgi:hypothetical protein